MKETVKMRLKERGMNLAGWARVNKESYGSFVQFLDRRWGKRATDKDVGIKPGEVSSRIMRKLVDQGLLDK